MNTYVSLLYITYLAKILSVSTDTQEDIFEFLI